MKNQQLGTIRNFRTGDTAQKRAGFRSLMSFVALLAPHWKAVALGATGLVVGAASNLFLPELLKRFIDTISTAPPDTLASALSVLVAATLSVFAVQCAAFYLRSRQFGIVSHRIARELRGKLYRGILAKPISFFDGKRAGDLASRLSQEVALIQDTVGIRLTVLVRYGIQVVVGTVLMAMVSAKLSIVLVITLIFLVLVGFLFARALRKASKAYGAEVAQLSGLFSEALGGVRFLQAHGATDRMSAILDRLNTVALEKGTDRTAISASFQSIVSFLLNSALVLLAVYGIVLVSRGEISSGSLGAFVSYAVIVGVSFSFLISSVAEVATALGAWERVRDLLVLDDGSHTGTTAIPTYNAAPRIVFSDVTFQYPGADSERLPALQQVSFTVEPESLTAFVGPSGAGKTTAMALLLGLYPATAGSITASVNGTPLTVEQLRSHVAYVPQEPQLFGLSLRENLLLGVSVKGGAGRSDAELRDALKRARLDELCGPQGELDLDQILGERGVTMSAGQRQRLGLARAFLSDAPLILLDEPTANLDAENEVLIQNSLRELLVGRTAVIIAHRLSTIMKADQVLVFEAGRLTEHGKPEVLAQSDGLFSRLIAIQRRSAA